MTDTGNTLDHSLDESTDVTPQHFDADGYVVGHPHHDAVTGDDLGPDGRLSEPDATVVLDAPSASIVPPPGGDPNAPVPGVPEGVPVDPDLTPDEPPPFAPDESVVPGPTVGGQAF